jgi:hypothetical protein
VLVLLGMQVMSSRPIVVPCLKDALNACQSVVGAGRDGGIQDDVDGDLVHLVYGYRLG